MGGIPVPTLEFEGYRIKLKDNGDGTFSITTQVSGGGTVTLKVNGINNAVQTLLNLIAGSGITLTDNGAGGVTIAASGFAPSTSQYVLGATDANLPNGLVNPTSAFGIDAAPLSPNVLDDEFNGSSLSGNWTITGGLVGAAQAVSKSLLSLSIGNSTQYLYKTKPAATCEFLLKFTVCSFLTSVNQNFGFLIGDSGTPATAKGVALTLNSVVGSMRIDNWTNPSTFSGNVSAFSLPTLYTPPVMWIKVKDDGVNFTLTFSYDGVNFLPANAPVSRTAFLTTPTTIGIFETGAAGVTTIYSTDYFRRTL